VQEAVTATPDPAVTEGGVIWLLRLFDVADVVDLERARALTLERGSTRTERRTRGPERVEAGLVFQAPPLALEAGVVSIAGMALRASVRLFDFGVVSVRFALDVAPGTPASELAALAARLDGARDVDEAARRLWQGLEGLLRDAIRGGHHSDVFEDYTLFEIAGVRGTPDALEALARLEAWKILLAEPERPMAQVVIDSHLGRAIQYYAVDAALVGWNAALVLDPDGSRDELEVLEIATARLLEMRYYDRLLARELAAVYSAAETARGSRVLFRSPFAGVARRAAALFVEITELYDRMEGSITLVGDAYTARIYREAAHRFRLDEASAGVKDKLATLARVSEILQGELASRRDLLLEVAVVLLIVLEIVLSVVGRLPR
jgi:hypothetical protein